MSDQVEGKIEITVLDSEEGATVNFTTNMALPDMNYWLDQVKHLIISGEAEISS